MLQSFSLFLFVTEFSGLTPPWYKKTLGALCKGYRSRLLTCNVQNGKFSLYIHTSLPSDRGEKSVVTAPDSGTCVIVEMFVISVCTCPDRDNQTLDITTISLICFCYPEIVRNNNCHRDLQIIFRCYNVTILNHPVFFWLLVE